MYDGEVIAKAEEMGKPGLVTIKQKQVGGGRQACSLRQGRQGGKARRGGGAATGCVASAASRAPALCPRVGPVPQAGRVPPSLAESPSW